MANYSVTDWTVVKGTVEDVLAAMEIQLETVDNSKTVRLAKVLQQPDKQYIGILIYDA